MRRREITAYLKSEKYTNAGRFKGNIPHANWAEKEKKPQKPNPHT